MLNVISTALENYNNTSSSNQSAGNSKPSYGSTADIYDKHIKDKKNPYINSGDYI